YVAWRDHEPIEGQFDFETKDIKKFLSICHEFGLYVYFRPGPYITNEMDTGGVPQWVLTKSTKKVRDPINNDGLLNLRTNDKDYIDATRRFFTALMSQVRPYLYTNGGPIILIGIENEFTWGAEFFEIDKWAKLPDGTWERPADQEIDIPGYMSNLRDIMHDLGVDVPLSTCPGDGTVSATGNVTGIIPMPNMYRNIPGKYTIPYSAWSVLNGMHDPNQFNGSYVDFPSGITETARDTNTLRAAIMAGFDAVFQFNIIAFHQEGHQNAILANSGDVADLDQAISFFKKFTDFTSWSFIKDFFLHPPMGFFGNTLDYYAAVSPSGVMREKFHQIRRSNLFFADFQGVIGGAGEAKRSVYRVFPDWVLKLVGLGKSYGGQDLSFVVENKLIGSPDPDVDWNERVNYFIEIAPNSSFISLYNDGVGHDAVALEQNSVIAYNHCFPKFTTLTVPIESCSSDQEADSHRRYTMILPVNVALPTGNLKIGYSTSEILTSRPNWGSGSLLVLYGSHGTQGETAFTNATLVSSNTPTQITNHGANESGSLTVSYTYDNSKPISFIVKSNISGDLTQVIIIDTYLAGKCWFPKMGNAMICGLDYLDEFMNEFPSEVSGNATVPIFTFAAPGSNGFSFGLGNLQAVNTVAGGMNSFLFESGNAPNPSVIFTTGKVARDDLEALPVTDNSRSWISIGDTPTPLENYNIATGHSWYQAQFTIPSQLLSAKNFTPSLYVPFASDFVGIYINGHYITTVNPLGTEIDSASTDDKYAFSIPKQFIVNGTNVISFRTEVWGHGSFLFFRGSLARISIGGGKFIDIPEPLAKGKIPSLGYDSVKGLQGNVTFSGLPVTNWKLYHNTRGDNLGFMNDGFDDSGWGVGSLPLTFLPGEIVWYRFVLDQGVLPSSELWNGPWNLRLQGKSAKATIYLNGRLI
ncbi:hypothetical protein HDU76_006731, partial [Blyttiomyces sp. JEL0837]